MDINRVINSDTMVTGMDGGKVIEKASGESFGELVMKNIIAPFD